MQADHIVETSRTGSVKTKTSGLFALGMTVSESRIENDTFSLTSVSFCLAYDFCSSCENRGSPRLVEKDIIDW